MNPLGCVIIGYAILGLIIVGRQFAAYVAERNRNPFKDARR